MTQRQQIVGLIVIGLVLIIGVVAFFVGSLGSKQPQTNQASNQNQTTGQTGNLVLGITDAALSMNNVTSVVLTIPKTEVHSTSSGWITISDSPKQFDLMALKKSSDVSLLAGKDVEAGTYDQLRLTISKVVVIQNGVATEAKLPSAELRVPLSMTVNAQQSSVAVVDFMADKSLHSTGNGKIIFSPVLKLTQEMDSDVEVSSEGKLQVAGGIKKPEEDFGMDEKGQVKSDFELEGDLEITENNIIQLKGSTTANAGLTLTFTAQNNSGITGTAKLTEINGKTKVVISVSESILGVLQPDEPAHIHFGACPNPGEIKYPLNDVVNGRSETTIDVSFNSLKVQLPLAINIHKSHSEIGTYVACTNVKF